MDTADRVREHTDQEVNQRVDSRMAERIREYAQADPAALSARMAELDREWDVERLLETNASMLAFTGLALGVLRDRRWLLLPSIVLPFLFQHAIQGWCPPLPVLRRMGFRTREEIDREKYALKMLRGDFEIPTGLPRAEAALRAIYA